jgi:hypothetical protein
MINRGQVVALAVGIFIGMIFGITFVQIRAPSDQAFSLLGPVQFPLAATLRVQAQQGCEKCEEKCEKLEHHKQNNSGSIKHGGADMSTNTPLTTSRKQDTNSSTRYRCGPRDDNIEAFRNLAMSHTPVTDKVTTHPLPNNVRHLPVGLERGADQDARSRPWM